jgi:DNA helicase-2/ATP-dependent DNA helicase PcrA
MSAQEHPEYAAELERLTETRNAIQQAVENISQTRTLGGDEWTSHSLEVHFWNLREQVKQSTDSPYFGRVDFCQQGKYLPEKFYIGYNGIDLKEYRVIDWRAPISRLFYGSIAEEQSYRAPGKMIHGKLFLKRHYAIENGELLEIADEVDRRADRPSGGKMTSSENYLLQYLYSRGDPRLQDIVKSIQAQQDRIIRASPNCLLLINGVAGSGKTSIAYHRLAYLLYPDSQTHIQPHRTIIFGPNRLFLGYVGDLLPQLGVKNVTQVTFDDWALEKMQLAIRKDGKLQRKYQLQEASLNAFLDSHTSRQVRASHWQRARIKGALKMKTLLERYIEFRRKNLQFPQEGFIYQNLGEIDLTLALTRPEIDEIYAKSLEQNLPFEQLRERVFYELNKLLREKYDLTVNAESDRLTGQADVLRSRAATMNNDRELLRRAAQLQDAARQLRNRAFALPENRRKVTAEAAARFKEDFDRVWPALQLRDDYYRLLQDSAVLKSIGADLLTDEDIALLAANIPQANAIDLEDIPALYYFYILMRGKGSEHYDHIVIDEAQDFSSLQVYLARLYSRDGSMTLAGDISQGIYAHRGISSWDEIRPVFQNDAVQFEEINQNYRSTREIVNFTNEILGKTGIAQTAYAKPFNRAGVKPRLVEVSNKKTLYAAATKDIETLLHSQIFHIGVLVKSQGECEELVDYFKKRQIEITSFAPNRDSEYAYQGGVVVLPVALAKGMEFQAALVLNADEKSYSGKIEYDGRLLYVACTRALHHLILYSVGPFSTFLDGTKDLAEYEKVAGAGH